MRYPSLKALKSAFGDETGAELRRLFLADEETLNAVEAVDSLRRQCCNEPDWNAKLTVALNAALGTHGEESIGECDIRTGPPICYLNTGDSYATTLLYFRDGDRWAIGAWGDLAESRRYQKYFRE